MTTLVLGASGATGKQLVNQLLQKGQTVKVIVGPAVKIPDTWINVGHFMASLVLDPERWDTWKGQMPVIYNKKPTGQV